MARTFFGKELAFCGTVEDPFVALPSVTGLQALVSYLFGGSMFGSSNQKRRTRRSQNTVHPSRKRLAAMEALEPRTLLAGVAGADFHVHSSGYMALPDVPMADGTYSPSPASDLGKIVGASPDGAANRMSGDKSPGGGTLLPRAGSASPNGGAGPSSTTNIQVTNTRLLRNGASQLVDSIPLGEMVTILLTFTTQNVPSNARYDLLFVMDGIPMTMDNIGWATGNGSWGAWMQGWFASPGERILFGKADANNEVVESNEADNAATQRFTPVVPSGLPGKLVYPIETSEDVSFVTTNYLDVDPRSDRSEDFRGGLFKTEGSQGWDIAPAHFAFQDTGIPIVAAASGTVIEAVDGNFDRQAITGGSSNPPSNLVVIDHGNGWTTTYKHLARDSVVVKVGDEVIAGQLIGDMGSSGRSPYTQLHFELRRYGIPVEPMFALGEYFVDPSLIPYQGDVPKYALEADVGVALSAQLSDGWPTKDSFAVDSLFQRITLTYWMSHVEDGDQLITRFVRPDGTTALSWTEEVTAFATKSVYTRDLSKTYWRPHLGQWKAEVFLNGQLVVEKTFSVVQNGLPPRVAIRDSLEGRVVDGRTTPLPFNDISWVRRNFTVLNYGDAPLEILSVEVPDGFTVIDAPTEIPGISQDTMVIAKTEHYGSKSSGAVRVLTNDPVTPEYWFNVEYVASDPGGFSEVTLPAPDVAYRMGDSAKLIDEEALFETLFAPPETLHVVWEGGRQAGDRIRILSQGDGTNQIRVDGDQVFYEGVQIGAIVDTGAAPLGLSVSLNSAAQAEAVSALLRRIAFETSSQHTGPRFLRVFVIDIFGESSTHAYKSVRVHPELGAPPVVSTVGFGNPTLSRSRIDQLELEFDSIVHADDAAFELRNRVSGAVVDLALERETSDGKSLFTFSFTGNQTNAGSLVDGHYELRVDSSQIYNASGVPLDGDGDGIPGGAYVFGAQEADKFYRFYGDINGDRAVGFADFIGFRQSYGSGDGDNSFDPLLDYNSDGAIGFADFVAFRNRFGTELPFA